MHRKRAWDGGRTATRPRTGGGARPTRRQALAGGGAVLVGAVAGCVSFRGDEPPDNQAYERLHLTPVYVEDGVGLSVPEAVPTVDATNNADVIVLPGDTAVGPGQAVDWLAAERVLALVGAGSEGTWFAWARSDVYAETFDGEGLGDSEPDPYLLVAAAVGIDTTTYRHSWSDTPRDRDVLRALDGVLVDLESRTPR